MPRDKLPADPANPIKRPPRQPKAAVPSPSPLPPTPATGRGDAAMARAHTGDAVATLVAIMINSDAPATARVSAANAVLDRAWGKPRQDFELSSTGDPVAAIQRARLRVHRQRPGAIGADIAAGLSAAEPGDG